MAKILRLMNSGYKVATNATCHGKLDCRIQNTMKVIGLKFNYTFLMLALLVVPLGGCSNFAVATNSPADKVKVSLIARCGQSVVKLLEYTDGRADKNTGEPLAILKVDEKEFVGALSLYGFPRGFNLGGTLINDDSWWHLPSLLWYADGRIEFRDASSPVNLSSCNKLDSARKKSL